MKSQITLLVRAMYSNPPAHGARIVNTVLQVDLNFYTLLINKRSYIITPMLGFKPNNRFDKE